MERSPPPANDPVLVELLEGLETTLAELRGRLAPPRSAPNETSAQEDALESVAEEALRARDA